MINVCIYPALIKNIVNIFIIIFIRYLRSVANIRDEFKKYLIVMAYSVNDIRTCLEDVYI